MASTPADPLDERLWRFDAVSLADVERFAALGTRLDRKYVIPFDVAGQLLGEWGSTSGALEIEGRRTFRYLSVYFDTLDHRAYLTSAHRRRRQFKVRTRRYEDSDLSVLEVKTKLRRNETRKLRVPHSSAMDVLTSEGCAFVDNTLGETGLGATLQPAVTVRYRRSTLVDLDIGWRCTIDREVRIVETDGEQVHLGDFVVVETKSVRAATPVDHWLWTHGHRPVGISKFGLGTAALNPDLPNNKWRRLTARHVEFDDQELRSG